MRRPSQALNRAALQRRHEQLAQERLLRRPLAVHHAAVGRDQVATAVAETLRSVVVGQPLLGQHGQPRVHVRVMLQWHVGEPQREAVAAQVAGAQLVHVARHLEHAHALDVEVLGLGRGSVVQAHPLACDGLLVLEAGPAGVFGACADGLRKLACRVGGVDAALFDPEVQVLTFAGGQVGGQLLDDEVFGRVLQPAGDRGDVATDERQRGEMLKQGGGKRIGF